MKDNMNKKLIHINIRQWFIFTEIGCQAIPYILDLTGENVNDDEISVCIHEQIYGGNLI